jgi:hypothetical protein
MRLSGEACETEVGMLYLIDMLGSFCHKKEKSSWIHNGKFTRQSVRKSICKEAHTLKALKIKEI